MPTPASHDQINAASPSHSCPPEDESRSSWRGVEIDEVNDGTVTSAQEVIQQPTPPAQDSQPIGPADSYMMAQQERKRMDTDEDVTAAEMLSPMSAEGGGGEKQEERELSALAAPDLVSPSMGYDFSNIRVCALSMSHICRYHVVLIS